MFITTCVHTPTAMQAHGETPCLQHGTQNLRAGSFLSGTNKDGCWSIHVATRRVV